MGMSPRWFGFFKVEVDTGVLAWAEYVCVQHSLSLLSRASKLAAIHQHFSVRFPHGAR